MSFQFSQDPEEDLPDWLKDLRRRQAGQTEPEAEDAEQPSPSEADAQAQPESAVPAEDTEPEVPDPEPASEEPDWLLDIRRRVQGDQPAETEPPAAEPEGEDGLEFALDDTQPKAIDDSEEGDPLEDSQPDFSSEAQERTVSADTWLPDTESNSEEDVESPEEEEEQALGDTQPQPSTTAFLDQPETAPFSEQQGPEDEAPEEGGPAFSAPRGTAGLPDWFFDEEEQSEDEEAERPHAPAFTGDQEDDDEELAPAELPSWLQALRPPGISAPSTYSESWDPDDGEGPLAGLSGVLPVEPEVLRVGGTGSLGDNIEINANQQRHVKTLQQLLEHEHEAKEDFHQRISLPTRLLRLGIAAVLLIATLIPLLTGSEAAVRPNAASHPESALFFQAAESLPADSPILVAFDVQPALYGEIAPVAATVLDHLLDRQARPIFISTDPTGPALVERLLREQLESQPSIASGNYLNLGYLSGGTAGLRQLATDPRTFHPEQWLTPSLASIESLSDFGLVLVISSDGASARAWIEQLSDELPNGLYVASSAQAGPLLASYIDSQPQTLRGLVAGFGAAAYYETLRGQEGPVRAYWDAYSYGVGAIVILILLGGLYGRLLHLRPDLRPKTFDEINAEDAD